LFKDLQFSLQPRLHLEIGLLRLVQAGKLLPIEEALASLGSGGGSAPAKPAAKKPAPPSGKPAPAEKPAPRSAPPPAPKAAPALDPPAPVASAPAASAPAPDAWRDRLHAALLELGMQFTADAIEHSTVTEAGSELHFTTPEEFRLAMNEKDILKAVQKIAGRPMRVKIKLGTPQAGAPAALNKPPDDASERALSHPEVRRFQEIFPDAQVRVVRNLKE